MTEPLPGNQGATGAPAPGPPVSAPVDREYLVLESLAEGTWKEKQKVKASSREDAYDKIESPNDSAKYMAIALRDWSPKAPKTETVVTTTWQ